MLHAGRPRSDRTGFFRSDRRSGSLCHPPLAHSRRQRALEPGIRSNGLCPAAAETPDQSRDSRLGLPAADPQGNGYARAAVTRQAELLGFGPDARDNIRLAVTEACTNCVLHAYDGTAPQSDPDGLEGGLQRNELVVVVQDWGAGLVVDGDTPRAAENSGLGMGLEVIRRMASSVAIISAPHAGTRVEMRFTQR